MTFWARPLLSSLRLNEFDFDISSDEEVSLHWGLVPCVGGLEHPQNAETHRRNIFDDQNLPNLPQTTARLSALLRMPNQIYET